MTSMTQMLKGILEGCVLKIISQKTRYSTEIVEALKRYGFEEVSEGTLFPMLLRLEKEGLFETERVNNTLGPSRKYYSLSNKGQLELEHFTAIWRNFYTTINNIIEEDSDE